MMTQTFTGHVFDPLKMTPLDVRLEDIVHGLSFSCRYNGQCSRFYSIAQHSIHVSNLLAMWGASLPVQLAGLMHDAAEAYLGDVITPIKCSSQINGRPFDETEHHVMKCIDHALNLPSHSLAARQVKEADRKMLVTEMSLLFPCCGFDFGIEPIEDFTLGVDFSPQEIERHFLSRFSQMHEDWISS